MDKDIIIFYHIFANGNYKKILDFHLNEIKSVGLYESCKQINFGLVYSNQDDLTYVKTLIESDDKLNLYYSREFENLPIKPISTEPHMSVKQMGEGETIMKMVEFSKSHSESKNHVYLFLHTKGASLPNKEEKRNQTKIFLEIDETISQGELTKKLLEKISYNVIHNWKEHLNELGSKNLYYYIWNFFWMNGKFLRKFDQDEYYKYSFRGQTKRRIYQNRHYTANFPLGVYEQVNKKRMFSRKFNHDPKNFGIYF